MQEGEWTKDMSQRDYCCWLVCQARALWTKMERWGAAFAGVWNGLMWDGSDAISYYLILLFLRWPKLINSLCSYCIVSIPLAVSYTMYPLTSSSRINVLYVYFFPLKDQSPIHYS